MPLKQQKRAPVCSRGSLGPAWRGDPVAFPPAFGENSGKAGHGRLPVAGGGQLARRQVRARRSHGCLAHPLPRRASSHPHTSDLRGGRKGTLGAASRVPCPGSPDVGPWPASLASSSGAAPGPSSGPAAQPVAAASSPPVLAGWLASSGLCRVELGILAPSGCLQAGVDGVDRVDGLGQMAPHGCKWFLATSVPQTTDRLEGRAPRVCWALVQSFPCIFSSSPAPTSQAWGMGRLLFNGKRPAFWSYA